MPSSSQVLIDQLRLSLSGSPIDKEILAHVSSVVVESVLHVADMAVITVDDIETTLVDSNTFAVGGELEVSLSDEQKTIHSVFKGEITAVEPYFENSSISLVIRAYDKSHRLHRGVKNKVFKNVTDSDIATQLGQDASLSVTADSTSETFEQVIQHSQTDFDFLVGRAARIGYEVLTGDGKLNFVKQSSPSSAALTVTFRVDLVTFRPRMTVSGQMDTVTVKGWDVKQKQAITGTASSSTVQAQIGIGKSGGSAASVISSATQYVSRIPANSQTDATTIAQGILDTANSRFIQADGETLGTPTMHAGMVIKIAGVGDKYAGNYRLTTVRHEYRGGDYRTYFTVEGTRPGLITYLLEDDKVQQGRDWGGVYPAVVTDNNDGDGDMAYVKVKFPWMDDTIVSNWARVVIPGGGANRGIYFMPEVNDEVLVAFEFGDFDRPYVIGGLYNGVDAPASALSEIVAESKVKTRLIKTRTGHTITLLDDSNGEEYIEIKDAKGNTSIKMDTANKKITLTSLGDVIVDATGNLTMTAKQDISIKTDSGNVTIQGMTFAAKGTSSAGVKSDSGAASLEGLTASVKGQTTVEVIGAAEGKFDGGAMTMVKGGIVMIN